MIYILLILIVLFCKRHNVLKTAKQKNYYICFISLIFILIIGLRCIQTGRDTGQYSFIYHNLSFYGSYMSFMSDFNNVNNIEYGYATWQWFIHLLLDYRGFLILQAMLMIVPFAYVVNKWSDNYRLSFLLYILLGYLTWDMCAARQAPAVSFTLLAFYFYKQNKIKNALLTYIIAISFHTTALVVLPFVFGLKLLRNDKLLITCIISSKLIGNVFIPLILPYMRIDYTDDVKGGGVGQLTYLGFLTILLIMLWIKKNYKIMLPDSFYMFSVMMILWPLIDSLPAAFRITFYFMIYLCFAIPNILVLVRHSRSQIQIKILSTFVTLIMSIYFYNMNYIPGRDVYPYYSVFEYPDNYHKVLYKY